MIISRKRLEEIVAGRLQERDQRLELLKRIDWVEDSLNRRMDRMQEQMDVIAERVREATHAELVERPVEGMPCRKGKSHARCAATNGRVCGG